MSGLDNTSYTVRSSTTAGDTLSAQDSILIMSFAGAKALAVQSAALAIPGRQYTVTNIASGAITITPAAGLIDGAATKVIAAGGTAISCVTFVSDGVGWRTVAYTVGS